MTDASYIRLQGRFVHCAWQWFWAAEALLISSLDIHIRKTMSASNTEEDEDSDYSDLVQDSEDEDDECNKEEEDRG
jgi:hypothetical protein